MHDLAKEEWRRVAPVLIQRRILTKSDLGTLEFYACAVGLARRAQIESEGLTLSVTGKNGVQRQHPSVKIARDAWNDARKFAGELGLTPASRHLRGGEAPPAPVNEPEEKDDGADDFTALDLGDDSAPGSPQTR
jgi:P27 family predicted phage terminase small subunit